MISIRTIFASLFLLIFSIWSASAQGECSIDVSSIIERVNTECASIGENQVCYGNRNVNATPRLNIASFEFDSPGDLADLYNIRSLVVDAVDPSTDQWGVAQMRLLIGSSEGVQDITMLLFGDFDVENAVDDTPTLDFLVQTSVKTVSLNPDASSAIIEEVTSGNMLIGLARLDDASWIQVENPVTRRVGWVENDGLIVIEDSLSVGILPVHDEQTPYFGAMQAFYFQNGETNMGCDSVESDGLLIQTPEGQARISLLINEVSIELTGGFNQNGEREDGTALIQANPLAGQDMLVNVLSGQATVQTESGTQDVTSGQRTTIPLTVDLRSPVGAPEPASNFSPNTVNVAPLLPAVNAPSNNPSSSGNGSSTNNSSNTDDNNGSSGNGGDNVQNVINTTGGGNGSNSSNGSNGGNGNTSGNGSNSNGNNNTQNTGNTVGSSSGNDSGTFQTSNDSSDSDDESVFGLGQQGNIIALNAAIAAMVLFILYLVRAARRRH